MKFLPVFFLILTVSSFSQDLTLLYKNELPPEVFKNKTYSEQVNTTMRAYCDINPELLYYYINFINQKLVDTSKDDYFSRNFADIKKSYQYKFNSYIMNLQKVISETKESDRLKGLCIDYLDDYLEDDINYINVSDLNNESDLNYRDFYVVKYYKLDPELKYNRIENYTSIRRRIEKEKISAYKEMLLNPSAYSKNDLQGLLLHWYILKDNQRIDASIIIVNVLKHYYSNDNMFKRTEFAVGYSFHTDYMFMDKRSYDTPLYSPSDIERKFRMNSLLISFRYKINISEYFGSFNFINMRLNAGYGIINNTFSGEKYGFWNTNVDGISNRSEVFDFNVNEIKLKSAEYAGIDITLPVIYFKEIVSLDVGAGISVLFTNYELTYDYEYRKFESEFLGPKIIETESGSAENKSMTSATFKYYPEFLFSFYLSNPFTLHLVTTMKMTSIEIGFNI